jgi:hypothetical protein
MRSPVAPDLTKVTYSSMVLFWTDSWNEQILASACPELFSFANDKGTSFKKALSGPQLVQNFHLPLSIQAHQQFQELLISLHQLRRQEDKDQRLYVWEIRFTGLHRLTKILWVTGLSIQCFTGFEVSNEAQSLFLVAFKG